MEVIIQPDAQTASVVAARLVSHHLRDKPNSVLGLATGNTPILLYNELVRKHREQHIDFSRVTTFNLDEFVGLPPAHPSSYHSFMDKHLFNHINVPRSHVFIPDGMAPDIPTACAEYERRIREAGGIDLQILGIGTEGHIGFNEPTSSLGSRTRTKTLNSRVRHDFAYLFGGEHKVPKHIITMGIGTIMEAREIVLLAFGKSKAQAVARAVEGPITSMMPASILQMHPVVKIIVDEGAASLLQNTSYYRWVYEGKPEWQRF